MSLTRYQKFNKLTDIPPEMLTESGIKCVMVDMDSTLIVWHGKSIEPGEKKWCRDVMDMGIKVLIVSNAVKERTKKIANMLGVEFISPAMKPAPFGLWRAAKMAGANIKECVMIGDQMLTDRPAAFFAGTKFILVEPLSDVDYRPHKAQPQSGKKMLLKGAGANEESSFRPGGQFPVVL